VGIEARVTRSLLYVSWDMGTGERDSSGLYHHLSYQGTLSHNYHKGIQDADLEVRLIPVEDILLPAIPQLWPPKQFGLQERTKSPGQESQISRPKEPNLPSKRAQSPDLKSQISQPKEPNLLAKRAKSPSLKSQISRQREPNLPT
jgi:hypothetical protein